jgi:hypothetical protein
VSGDDLMVSGTVNVPGMTGINVLLASTFTTATIDGDTWTAGPFATTSELDGPTTISATAMIDANPSATDEIDVTVSNP